MNTVKIIFLSILVSCGIGGARGPLNFEAKVDEQILAEEVNFAVLQKEILPKCIGCHQGWVSEEAIEELIVAGQPEESPFFDSVKTGWMPKRAPPLNSFQLEIVRNYILNIRTQ
jgi:hypothetical protein